MITEHIENSAEFFIPEKDCDIIEEFIHLEKDNWQKDLNNVKALTSGFNPDYGFIHDTGRFICKDILPKITNHMKWKKSCWWVNFYKKGNYTDYHIHLPEEMSCIIIVKETKNDCLYFYQNQESFLIKEQRGLGLLFPSSVPHSVSKVDSDRITIAIDFVKNQ